MSKFNQSTKNNNREESYEGELNYKKNPVEDWFNFLFSSYLEDRYYETASKQMTRYLKLTENMRKKYGEEFVGKAAMFARNEIGIRSISQLTAAYLNQFKFNDKRRFYKQFCHRPDDVSEMFAAIDLLGQKRSHALVRGCGDYLSELNEYSIGKYKLNAKEYNMFDLINITHANSDAINKYKNGRLEAPDTWEVKISTASEDERDGEWKRLVEENKLGYLALIRNIRNIVDSNVSQEWIEKYLVPQLTNEQAIKKSLVYPYQIYTAWKFSEVSNLSIQAALDKAFKISCSNMPELKGSSVILLDVSGSMDDCYMSWRSKIRIKEIGAVYAAAIMIANPTDTDFIKFGSYAKMKDYNVVRMSAFDLIDKMQDNEKCDYGTDITKAYELIEKYYDRIFIISDMQTMKNHNTYWGENGIQNYKEYCKTYGDGTLVYSFDLGNYSNQTENPNNKNVHLLTSISDKVFDMLRFIEDGGNNLVDYIEQHYNW